MRTLALVLATVALAGLLMAQSDDDPERNLVVVSVGVTPGSKISSPNLDFITREIESHKYSEKCLGEITEGARYALQTKGYFRAAVSEPSLAILNKSAVRESIGITLAVEQGEQYRLKEITFREGSIFNSAQLREQFPLRSGDIFDTEVIRVGLENLRKLYASQGYVNFVPVPNTETDDTVHLVSLHIDLDETPGSAQLRMLE